MGHELDAARRERQVRTEKEGGPFDVNAGARLCSLHERYQRLARRSNNLDAGKFGQILGQETRSPSVE